MRKMHDEKTINAMKNQEAENATEISALQEAVGSEEGGLIKAVEDLRTAVAAAGKTTLYLHKIHIQVSYNYSGGDTKEGTMEIFCISNYALPITQRSDLYFIFLSGQKGGPINTFSAGKYIFFQICGPYPILDETGINYVNHIFQISKFNIYAGTYFYANYPGDSLKAEAYSADYADSSNGGHIATRVNLLQAFSASTITDEVNPLP